MSLAQFDQAVIDVRKFTQSEIVRVAKSEHAQVMRTDPKPNKFVRHVDGKEAPEEAVRPDGVIVYDYSRLDLVKKLALKLLDEFSPEKSGDYKRGHRVVMDTPTEVRITNTVPYSRVIENAKRGEHVLRIQKGGHVYDKTARKLRTLPEVGNSTIVTMTFMDSASPVGVNANKEERRAAQWPTLILKAAR